MNTTIQIRIDKKTKKLANDIFKDLGLDMSTGVKMYLRQVAISKSIPFGIRTENGFTPAYEQELIKEADWAVKHGKGYKNAKELHDSIFIK